VATLCRSNLTVSGVVISYYDELSRPTGEQVNREAACIEMPRQKPFHAALGERAQKLLGQDQHLVC
jgi:hypothetical protein